MCQSKHFELGNYHLFGHFELHKSEVPPTQRILRRMETTCIPRIYVMPCGYLETERKREVACQQSDVICP